MRRESLAGPPKSARRNGKPAPPLGIRDEAQVLHQWLNRRLLDGTKLVDGARMVVDVLRGIVLGLLSLMILAVTACVSPGASPVTPSSDGNTPTAAQTPPTAVARAGGGKELLLATTTSTQDSGLLDVLVPIFEQRSGYTVKTISVGTGAALALGARGEADVVLVHAPEAEKAWMAQGNGTRRLLVMHNDFVLAGPAEDPAHIAPATSAATALGEIAASGSSFVSRGDSSGTHQTELGLWKAAGLEPKGQPWYVESGTGMGQTLTIADQKRAYTLTDRATWLAWQSKIGLSVLFQGDRALFNVYHVLPVNPSRFPNVRINAAGGEAFAQFLVDPDTQATIGAFGKDRYGQALFVPDAGKRDEDVGG